MYGLICVIKIIAAIAERFIVNNVNLLFTHRHFLFKYYLNMFYLQKYIFVNIGQISTILYRFLWIPQRTYPRVRKELIVVSGRREFAGIIEISQFCW